MGRPFNLERVARDTWVTSLPISVFHYLSVLELELMYAPERHVRHEWLLNATNSNGGHNSEISKRSYDRYHSCVASCGETTFSPQDHPVRVN